MLSITLLNRERKKEERFSVVFVFIIHNSMLVNLLLHVNPFTTKGIYRNLMNLACEFQTCNKFIAYRLFTEDLLPWIHSSFLQCCHHLLWFSSPRLEKWFQIVKCLRNKFLSRLMTTVCKRWPIRQLESQTAQIRCLTLIQTAPPLIKRIYAHTCARAHTNTRKSVRHCHYKLIC